MQKFGVIVTCSARDLMFAKGCCASIRYFMDDVPLCLLADGDMPLEPLVETYKARVIKKSNVRNPLLRDRSFGFGITKMVAFWESPFEEFLLIDADTCVWGDMREHLLLNEYDVIIDIPCYSYSLADISKWFFDVQSMTKYDPGFRYKNRPYVCTGVIFSRRGIFDIEEYKNILDFMEEHPGVFLLGEMGFLNYLFFKYLDEGRIRLGTRDIQYIMCDFGLEKARNQFPLDNGHPSFSGHATTLHWCGGLKPVRSNRHRAYVDPMTFFRRKFLRDSANISYSEIDRILKIEDKGWDKGRLWRGLLHKIRTWTNLSE